MEEKPLNETAEQPPTDELLHELEQVSRSVGDMQEQLNRTRKLEKLLTDLTEFRDQSWWVHVKAACEREKDLLKSFREQGHSAIQSVETLYREADAKVRSVIQNLPGEFERAAKSESISLDFSRSRHPKYLFSESGFIEVLINDKKQNARISTREGNLGTLPADAGAILEKVKAEDERLFGRKFNGKRFLADLRAAYLAAIKAKKTDDGEPVPIREVFNSLSGRTKAYKGYKKDEFLVDLSKLVQEGPAETDGLRFELQQTKDTAEGMLLLGVAGRGMVNLLIFRKPDKTS
ncbi:MAG: hypothetical protein P1U58_14315 [Verrucomicrobiales bacterium]|nr:hypothetical protein [Verrucomicrobiales bacterium]